MKTPFLFFGFFLLYSHSYLLAQDGLKFLYEKAVQFYNDSNYTEAIKHLQALDSDDDNSVYREKRSKLTKKIFEKMDHQKKKLEDTQRSLIAQTRKLDATVKTLKVATQKAVKSLLQEATRLQDQDPLGALDKIATAKSLADIPLSVELKDHIVELNRLIDAAYQTLGAATKRNILHDLDKSEDQLKARIGHLRVLDSIPNFPPDSIVFVRNALISNVLGRIDDTSKVFKFASVLRLSKLLKPIEEGADSRICTHFEVSFCYTVLGNFKAAEQVLDSISSELIPSVSEKILAFKQVDSLQKLSTLYSLIKSQASPCLDKITERYLPVKLIPIPAGSIIMNKETVPVQPFLIRPMEVSFFEYDLFSLATKRVLPLDNTWGRGNKPAINVSWEDAIVYCNWRSKLAGLDPAYHIDREPDQRIKNVSFLPKSSGYRLPDETEWQFAAGNGKNDLYSWGSDFPPKSAVENLCDSLAAKINPLFKPIADYRDAYGATAPIGSFAKNHFGLYDMCGNVWEWCWNLFSEPGYGKSDQNKENRVLRGGAWSSDSTSYQVSHRIPFDPKNSNYSIGFRIVKSISNNKPQKNDPK